MSVGASSSYFSGLPCPTGATMADDIALLAQVVGPQPEWVYERPIEHRGVRLSGDWALQIARMPPKTRALLVDGADPESVPVPELVAELRGVGVALRGVDAAGEADSAFRTAVLAMPGTIDALGCSRLRAAVDHEIASSPAAAYADSVDGAPAHQLNLDRQKLEDLVGFSVVEKLLGLPAEFARHTAGSPPCIGDAWSTIGSPREIFVRRYSTDTRPWIPFHCDRSAVTVNVALGDDSAFSGGELLACVPSAPTSGETGPSESCQLEGSGGGLRIVRRREGEATVHSSGLLHGVRMMTAGNRYSLILFFGSAADEDASASDIGPGAAACARAAGGNGACGGSVEEGRVLHSLLSTPEMAAACESALGSEAMIQVRRRYRDLFTQDEDEEEEERMFARVGLEVDAVVARMQAPYLRPTRIRAAAAGDPLAWWSLSGLLTYLEGHRPRGRKRQAEVEMR